MDSFDILVIILSSTLAVFLILAIIATIFLIKLMRKFSDAADSAKLAVENIQEVTNTVKKVANGTVVANTLNTIFDKFKRSGSGKEK